MFFANFDRLFPGFPTIRGSTEHNLAFKGFPFSFENTVNNINITLQDFLSRNFNSLGFFLRDVDSDPGLIFKSSPIQ